MKATGKTLFTVLILVLATTVQAQYSGASVGYVKVKDGQWSNYRELEKEAKKVHQVRVERGIITQWHLYRKMYSGANDPYDFILVSFFDDYKKSTGSFPQEMIDELFTKEEQTDWRKRANASRSIIKNEYYDQVMAAEGGSPAAKYIRINRYRVKQGGAGTYIDSRREITKPLFEELIKRGASAGWSMWRKLTYDQKFQFVTVDAFAEFGDWKSSGSYEEVFQKVHPNVTDETMTEYRGARVHVSTEYWRLVESTDPAGE